MVGKTVLWVAQEESFLQKRRQILQSSAFVVMTASDDEAALGICNSHPIDAVVVECTDHNDRCISVPPLIKKAKPRTPVIFLSEAAVARNVSSWVDVFLEKNSEENLLSSKLESLILLRSHSHPELEREYVVFADASRRYLDCSDGACQLLGYERMDLTRMSIEDVSYVPERVSELFAKFVRQGQQEGEYIVRHKSGKPLLLRYRSYSFPDGCLAAVWEPIRGWRELYSAALMELDPRKLKACVESASAAVEERANELARENQRASAEWQMLQDARSGLKILRREGAE